ncbi:hypothetical protein V2V63_32055, partial [Pseudomonas aeruginosa]
VCTLRFFASPICCHPFEDDSLNYPVVTVSKGGSTIEVQTLLRNTLSSFIIGAYSSLTGQSVLLDAVSKFALQTKVEDYSVTFKGFSSIKDAFDSYQANAGKSQFDAFCQAAGLSTWQSDFGAKAREHSDSECAIARKLVEEGKFEEHYKFSEGKPLYASLFVGRSYELDAN